MRWPWPFTLFRKKSITESRRAGEWGEAAAADFLKARGYRWSDGSDGRPKSWWVEVADDMLDEELRYLRTEIYRWPDADPPIKRLTALERFKA